MLLRCFTPQEKHTYRKHSEGNFLIIDEGDLSAWKLHKFCRKKMTNRAVIYVTNSVDNNKLTTEENQLSKTGE